MGRPKGVADGGLISPVLNRANVRLTILEKDEDYQAFERVLQEAVARTATRLPADCVMPNHRHLVVWPLVDGELSRFAGRLTLTHTQRWHAHRHSVGSGAVYQGGFQSFPGQSAHPPGATRWYAGRAWKALCAPRADRCDTETGPDTFRHRNGS